MIRKRIFPVFIVSVGLLVVSCDKLEPPYATTRGIVVDTTKRTVLLEDYTGIKCVNCPTATEVAQSIQTVYKGQVIVMAVHAGYFAEPDPSGPYAVDYRVPEGMNWFNDFALVTNPMGMVNRTDFNGGKKAGKDEWAGLVEEVAEKPRVASVSISLDVPAGQKQDAEVTVDTRFLTLLEGAYNLSVCILEDSIVGWQKNNNPDVGPTPDIENYVFMDMLRAVLNGTYGEELTTAVDTSVVYSKTYPVTFDTAWTKEHCSVVAFVFDQASDEILEVKKIPVSVK